MSEAGVALVTGASSGIGRASALALGAAGYRVVAAGRRAELLEELARQSGRADNFLGVACDVGSEADVAALFEQAVERFGRVDVVFNNAGRSSKSAPIDETTLEEFLVTVEVNLTGAFLVAREAVRVMKRQSPRGGRIINNGSISAHVPRPNAVPYNMTKSAITGLTKTISLEGRGFDIACGQIDIGNTATDMTGKMATGMLQASGVVAPEPTFPVGHVADAVVYMAGLPLSTNVQFMTVTATEMPYIGRG